MNYLKLFLLFLLNTTVTHLGAQQPHDLQPCGTAPVKSPWLIEYQKNPAAFQKSADTLYVPVTVHIVGKSDGSGYMLHTSMLEAFCTLNKDYRPARIQFFIEGQIRYINNSTYYDHNYDDGEEMMDTYNVPNTINCYIVKSPAGNCGYAAWDLGIALAASCTSSADHTWAHEIGHFLSLPHPFFGWEGYDHDYNLPAPDMTDWNEVERTDGSNCFEAGDGFCDTKPDYLNYRWPCNSDHESTITEKDPDGVEFRSDGTLFMSYSFDECSNRFSPEQIEAMRANLNFDKPNLLYNQTPETPVNFDTLIALSPVPGDTIHNFNQVLFEWEPVPNATFYVVETTKYADFPFILNWYLTYTNSATATDLKQDKPYFWRVRAYNSHHTCLQMSGSVPFFTGSLTASYDRNFLTGLQIQPNPAQSGSQALITFYSEENTALGILLQNAAGQTVRRFDQAVFAGENEVRLPLENLPAGLYFVTLQSANGVHSQKFTIYE